MAIRFAPLIRVSTEQQERKGESIRTQRRQIEAAVKAVGGVIPEYCQDKYSGQEHATPSYEREMLANLLEDASHGLFDAVIVVDPSRWSRDNRTSKEGLEILRRNGIRFFIGTSEHDLVNPDSRLMLGMFAEMNEYYAANQSLKSIVNRIERAKRGMPVAGKLPWGRTFTYSPDRKTGEWGLVDGAKEDIEWAAREYLAGKSMVKIAPKIGLKSVQLSKIFRERASDIWMQSYNSPKHNISEEIPTKVPRLLDEVVILAIRERAKKNRTYKHGAIKYEYLLRRFVFCAECGYALMSQTNHNKRKYYRHPPKGSRVKGCSDRFWARVDQLDEAVMAHLFHMLGDMPAIEQAMERAVPSGEEVRQMKREQERFESELVVAQNEKKNLITSVQKGLLADDEIADNKAALDAKISGLTERLLGVEAKLSSGAVQKHKRQAIAAKVRAVVRRSRSRTYEHFMQMTYDQKRALVRAVFDGKDADGKPFGVHLSKDAKGQITYEIYGALGDNVVARLPMSNDERNYLLNKVNILNEVGPEDTVKLKLDY